MNDQTPTPTGNEIKYISISRVNDSAILLQVASDKCKKAY